MSYRPEVRTVKVELNSEFTGVSFTVRTNPPMWVFEEMGSRDLTRMLTGFTKVVIAWEGVVDDEGKALKEPNEKTVRLLTRDLFNEMMTRATTAITEASATQRGLDRVRRTARMRKGTPSPTRTSIQKSGAYGPTSSRAIGPASPGAPG